MAAWCTTPCPDARPGKPPLPHSTTERHRRTIAAASMQKRIARRSSAPTRKEMAKGENHAECGVSSRVEHPTIGPLIPAASYRAGVCCSPICTGDNRPVSRSHSRPRHAPRPPPASPPARSDVTKRHYLSGFVTCPFPAPPRPRPARPGPDGCIILDARRAGDAVRARRRPARGAWEDVPRGRSPRPAGH